MSNAAPEDEIVQEEASTGNFNLINLLNMKIKYKLL